MMRDNDNKTRERELGQPGLEHMHLVHFCDLKVEELFRPPLISFLMRQFMLTAKRQAAATSVTLCQLILSSFSPLTAFLGTDNDISHDVEVKG